MDYILQEQKGIKKSFDNGAATILEKYTKLPIFDVRGSSEWSEILTSTEGFSGSRELTAYETPDLNALGDGYSVTVVTKRFGNGYQISSTDQEKMGDDTTKVKAYLTRQRNRLLRDIKYLFAKNLHDFITFAFVTTKYAAPDTKALIATNHTWNSGKTFSNKGTAALSATAIQAAEEAAVDILDAVEEPMGVNYDTIVVRKGSAAAVEAKKLFAFGIIPTKTADINIYEGTYKIIELTLTPTTSKLHWFLFDTNIEESPLYIGIKKSPHYTEPKIQDNEAIRQNVEGFWKQGIINMPYMVYGSNGTT